jgi:hypothetical protein
MDVHKIFYPVLNLWTITKSIDFKLQILPILLLCPYRFLIFKGMFYYMPDLDVIQFYNGQILF